MEYPMEYLKWNTPENHFLLKLRDCSLFMSREGGQCLEWGGGKIFKTKGNGGVFFLIQ